MIKKILVILVAFVSLAASSQTNWLKSYGNLVNEEILDAVTDQNGDIISVGYFSGPTTIGTTNLTTYGNSDILVMKTSSTGTVIWAIKAGGTGPDRAYSVAVDDNGNSYITGYFYNSATFGTLTATGQDRDVYAAKIDANGNFLWVQNCGGQFGDTGYGIEVDQNQNVYITGQYRGNGIFGADNFVSMIDPGTGTNSYDFFLSKLDPTGNFVWTRDAQAEFDDRGLSLTIDDQDNIYVAGQFSDTIVFQNVHNNQAMNAGFLIKYDALGNEIWFDKYRAAQVILYDVKWQNDNLYLTGDFKGNMQVSDANGNQNFSSGGEYNILVSKSNEDGILSWFSSNFSENEITSKQLVLDNNNDIYLAGLFKCDFTQMNEFYGNSTFLSVGYRDVHYIKYNNDGEFLWARQFGSNEDDYCSAIVCNGIDHPVLAGSFANAIIVPSGDNFTGTGYSLIPGGDANCADSYYGAFKGKYAAGSKDIFITDPFDFDRLPFDYYNHATACDFDTLVPCIEACQDSVDLCYTPFHKIYVNHFQIGLPVMPKYDYLWNTGSDTTWTYAITTGEYSIKIWREDGCAFYDDTMHVTIHPLPQPPLITDSWGYHFMDPSAGLIDTCYQDSLLIYASPGDTITQLITWSGGIFIDDSTRLINVSGIYNAVAYTQFGCTSSNNINVILDDFAIHDTLAPAIHFSNAHLEATDTLYVCEEANTYAYIIDTNFIATNGSFPYKTSKWYLNGSLVHTQLYFPDSNEFILLSFPDTGWYAVDVHLINECGDSVDYFMHRDIYVVIVPDPYLNVMVPSILGNYCPGDTIPIYAITSSPTINWAGPFVADYTDSIYAILNLSDQLFSVTADTITPFITCWAQIYFTIPAYPIPQIEIVDGAINGGIICPNDSLELHSISGIAWEWVGPQGDTLATTQNVWVDLPGFYHCIVTDNYGCVLTSNFVEAKEYSSPYMVVDPPFICEGETAEITVVANPYVDIIWYAPLSGNSYTQIVDTAGVYYCETNFCNITLIDSVIVTISVPVANIIAVPNTPICPGDTVTLFANGGMMDYWWNGGNQSESIIETSLGGQYILTTENEWGCQAQDTIVIDYLSNPQPPVAIDTSICLGGDVVLIANASDTIYWFSSAGILVNIGDTLLISSVNGPLSFDLQNKDSLCFSLTSDVEVLIEQSSITPIITSDSIYCEGEDILLETSVSSGLITYNWIFPDASIVTSQTILLANSTLANSGAYSIFYSDVTCTSDTAVVNVVVNPLPSATITALSDLLICPGDSSYLLATTNADSIIWTGGLGTNLQVGATQTGNYFYTAFLNGCNINSDTISVLVNAATSSIPPIDTTICDNSSVVLETNSSSSVLWFNSDLDTISTTANYTTGNLISDTLYYFQITETGFCPTDLIEANVTVINNNYQPQIIAPAIICQGDSISVTSGDSGVSSFEWFSGSTILSTSSSLLINADSAGTFSYGLILTLGACTTDTGYFDVVVSPYPQADISALSSLLICPGDSVILLATTNADSIFWPAYYSLNLSLTVYDQYGYFYEAYLNGCMTTSDTISVLFNAITNFVGSFDTIICENEIAVFDVNTTGDVVWLDENLDTISTTNPFTSPQLFDDAYYYFSVTDSGLCPSDWNVAYVNVIGTNYIPDYTGITDLCIGDSIVFVANDLTMSNYFWISNGDTVSTNSMVTMPADSAGNVSLILVVGTNNCLSDSAFITININDIPVFVLPEDTSICINEQLVFDTDLNYSFDWFYNSDSIAIDTMLVITFTNNIGCVFTDTLIVDWMDCSLFLPNVFTPDGDGVNDVLKFSAEKGEILSLKILNRWGHSLYEGTTGEWDGLDITGSESVSGTYFYVIEYQEFDGTIGVEQGWFFLSRK